ncbi:MAG: aspartate-semialdehyde dehydrogenase [Candidatus Hydrogenedentota bacterium]|nr:MAG: aspartate-semialdehyde dehydrogenase [Candidatus Hydrogenedentota bacterium]
MAKNIAIVGATGAVGLEFLSVLEKRDFPVGDLKLLASPRSAGKELTFRGKKYKVEALTKDSFQEIDIALFSAGSSISKEYAQHAINAGAVVVDNSSAFRMDKDVPLVVPEINPEAAKNHNGIIANPNCSTIIMLMAVYPIHQKYPVSRIIVSTYQAASGAGMAAMQELEEGTRAILDGKPFTPKVLPHVAAFNVFSHNSAIDETGYNQEERKMVYETWKILEDDTIKISATCVRVPVLRAHSESIHLGFRDKTPSEEEARELLSSFPGVQVVDDREHSHFPMPIEASGQFDCFVGRIRKDIAEPEKEMELFVAGDQLLKGAALNAVQIAELLL